MVINITLLNKWFWRLFLLRKKNKKEKGLYRVCDWYLFLQSAKLIFVPPKFEKYFCTIKLLIFLYYAICGNTKNIGILSIAPCNPEKSYETMYDTEHTYLKAVLG